MACGDVLSLEDLQTAKKHQIFEAEVITGKAGGVAGGATIDTATNPVTGQVQKTMPAILRDLGFEPASFDFTTGGTLGVNDRNKAVLWPLASGGDGDWYYWEGALPKTIPSATPYTTGGVADGAWRPVGDITLRSQISDPEGATLYPDLQIARWRDRGDIRGWGALPGIANAAATAAAMNATYAARAGKSVIIPPIDGDWYIDSTVNAGYSNTTTIAYGARIFPTFDGLMFNLNQDANPSAIDGANSKAYINWFGGMFQCALPNPTNAVAMRAYGIRQANIENCIFGHSGEKRLNAGIQIAGLGGHLINKNRFLLVDTCIDCPQWATDPADVAGHITTSSFIGNNFILDPGQKAFWVRGGWNRWIIQGGFVNGSGVPTHHFTNFGDCKGLNVIGVGFEQAVAGGKFLYIQDTSGLSASSINIAGSVFNGDPPGGGHVAIELERCINVSIGDGTRVEGSTGRGNASVKCDANCLDVVIDPSCRLPGPGVVIAMSRREIAMGKTFQRISELVLPGYNGNSFSSGTVTLDMKTLMGFSYPRQLAPLAYDLVIQARDSGSAASTTVQLEVTKNLGATTSSSILNLRGLPNDQRMGGNFHINAEADGSIALRFTASGAGTMDVWVYVVGVYN